MERFAISAKPVCSNVVYQTEDLRISLLTPDDLVLLQNETSCVPYIARRCRELGIPLAFNPSPISRVLLESFPVS